MAKYRVWLHLLVGFWLILGLAIKAQAQPVKVEFPCYCTQYLPFVVGQQLGYYKEEGLEVKLVLASGTLASVGLLSGEMDFQAGGSTPIIVNIRGGRPIKTVFSPYWPSSLWLYSKPTITEIKQLKGRKVAVSGRGTPIEEHLEAVLKKRGLDGERDVAFVAMGLPSTRYVALTSGSIDAAVLTETHIFAAREAGFRELADFSKEGMVLLSGSINVLENVLQSKPALVEKFVRATLKALTYTRENRSGTIRVMFTDFKVEEKLAPKIYDLMQPGFTQDGTVSEEIQKKAIEQVLTALGSQKTISLETIFDYSLPRRIQRELQTKGWRP